ARRRAADRARRAPSGAGGSSRPAPSPGGHPPAGRVDRAAPRPRTWLYFAFRSPWCQPPGDAMTRTMADTISYAVDGNVARITLDDGKVNAMSLPFFDALGAALDRAEREKPGAVVIAGRPGCFSAGLDLKLMPTLAPDALQRTLLAFGRTMLRVFTFPIPTVAALTGHAIAGGAMLAFACDLRYAADGAYRLHLNEVAVLLALASREPGQWPVDARSAGELVPRAARGRARHRPAEPPLRTRHRRGVRHDRRGDLHRRARGEAPPGRAPGDGAVLRP